MSAQAHNDPSPFTLPAGADGVLLIHGFTGSPAEMRPLGRYLHERGLTVAAPLLPGHGATPADLNRRRWQEWLACAEAALAELQAARRRVFVAGLSMGALLTLLLAARQPNLAGAIVYSPAIIVNDPRSYLVAVLKYLIPSVPKPVDYFADPAARVALWTYPVYPTAAAHELMKLIGAARRALPSVACPLLIIYSRRDPTIHPRSAQAIYDGVRSAEKHLIELGDSGHVITLDSEWEQAAEESYRFMAQSA